MATDRFTDNQPFGDEPLHEEYTSKGGSLADGIIAGKAIEHKSKPPKVPTHMLPLLSSKNRLISLLPKELGSSVLCW